ncbi:uncharacterized protein APUU_30263A [Aspergillus puulaauensis]|uniref:C2H2-type domain-containing protein n=1 Tax=Aspergillus puulaauensis TaxID=1220207 RepID=A0A7R7XJC9_9EURO|nr:uncharacterized protein APUU_30263A [Aspergillus puulaauensis]BCS22038.1 hypothetical protein APUU_30263A [Aspergillus puulaauensis]
MSSSLPRGRRRQRKTSQEERICSVCSQSFKKAEHLARHFRSHTKERPFMCQVCGKLYARQDTLLRHSRSHHLKGVVPVRQLNDGHNNIGSDPALDQGIDAPSADSSLLLSDHALPELQHGSYTATTSSFPHSPEDVPFGPGGDTCWNEENQRPTFNQPETDTRPWPTLWNSQWDEDWTSLLASNDFDLDAVNQSLLECTGAPQDTAVDHTDSSMPIDPDINHGSTVIQRKWHTFSATPIESGYSTPDRPRSNGTGSQMRTRADDRYRQKLAESLRQRVQPGTLPSTNFLVYLE